VTEDTLIKTMPRHTLSCPERGWDRHADANLVVLAADLDEAGREAALSEVQAHWRRSCIRVVTDDEPLPQFVHPDLTIREVIEAM
jgi:hypothetical protein